MINPQHNSMLCVRYVDPRNIVMGCWDYSLNMSHSMVVFSGPTNGSILLSNVMPFIQEQKV